MTRDDKQLLDRLLRDDDGLHAVTAIKHHPRDFSHKQIITEIERGEQLHGLYQVAERIIADTDLSVESVRFYASLVDYYTVYKLKRMNRTMTRLYLLCFVRNRYQRLNDHLIAAFCALVRRYTDEVNERAKDAHYQHRRQANEDIDQGAKVLFLFVDPKVPDNRPFGDVRAQAKTMLPSDRIARLCDQLSGNNDFEKLREHPGGAPTIPSENQDVSGTKVRTLDSCLFFIYIDHLIFTLIKTVAQLQNPNPTYDQ
ncbi:MAG: hypothetical protein AB8B87_24980 [Granulosicoccus sp.]